MPNSPTSKTNFTSTSLGDILTQTIAMFQQAGFETPDLDARWLIGDLLKLSRIQLFTQNHDVLSQDQITLIAQAIEQRLEHKSVARILGKREFWGLAFDLNEATLEPRPDSETLVEVALKHIPDQQAPLRIVDLGTGTGCLLLSLLHELPHATGLGVDLAPRAVEQAYQNAAHHGLSARAEFIANDWLSGIDETFDIIIANPPYIASGIITSLANVVREYDPLLALDGGKEGLDPYHLLIPQMPQYLKPNGFALFEIGYDQAPIVPDLMRKYLADVTLYKDLGGNDRCVFGRKSF